MEDSVEEEWCHSEPLPVAPNPPTIPTPCENVFSDVIQVSQCQSNVTSTYLWIT